MPLLETGACSAQKWPLFCSAKLHLADGSGMEPWINVWTSQGLHKEPRGVRFCAVCRGNDEPRSWDLGERMSEVDLEDSDPEPARVEEPASSSKAAAKTEPGRSSTVAGPEPAHSKKARPAVPAFVPAVKAPPSAAELVAVGWPPAAAAIAAAEPMPLLEVIAAVFSGWSLGAMVW